MASVRIVCLDFYLSQPLSGWDPFASEFRGASVTRVPVIRIYGTTENGKKACVHVHGVFPYVYIPYDGSESPDKLSYQIAAALDATLNISLGQPSSSQQHVYKVALVSALPFYGFHAREHQFFKISFYNPLIVKKACALLENGNVLGKMFQPHESHIPFHQQFMIDYNLFGMNFVKLSEVVYRSEMIAKETDVRKMTTCELEMDCLAENIMNRLEIRQGCLSNPGIGYICEDEKQRRRNKGQDTQIEDFLTQNRVDVPPTITHEKFRQLLMTKLDCKNVKSKSVINASVYAVETPEDSQQSILTASGSILDDSSIMDTTIVNDEPSILQEDIDLLMGLLEDNRNNRENRSVEEDSILSQVCANEEPEEDLNIPLASATTPLKHLLPQNNVSSDDDSTDSLFDKEIMQLDGVNDSSSSDGEEIRKSAKKRLGRKMQQQQESPFKPLNIIVQSPKRKDSSERGVKRKLQFTQLNQTVNEENVVCRYTPTKSNVKDAAKRKKLSEATPRIEKSPDLRDRRIRRRRKSSKISEMSELSETLNELINETKISPPKASSQDSMTSDILEASNLVMDVMEMSLTSEAESRFTQVSEDSDDLNDSLTPRSAMSGAESSLSMAKRHINIAQRKLETVWKCLDVIGSSDVDRNERSDGCSSHQMKERSESYVQKRKERSESDRCQNKDRSLSDATKIKERNSYQMKERSESYEQQNKERSVSDGCQNKERSVNDALKIKERNSYQMKEHSESYEQQIKERSVSDGCQNKERSVNDALKIKERNSHQMKERSERYEQQNKERSESYEQQIKERSVSDEQQNKERSLSNERQMKERGENNERKIKERNSHQIKERSKSYEQQNKERSESHKQQIKERRVSDEHQNKERSLSNERQMKERGENNERKIKERNTHQIKERNDTGDNFQTKKSTQNNNCQNANIGDTNNYSTKNYDDARQSSVQEQFSVAEKYDCSKKCVPLAGASYMDSQEMLLRQLSQASRSSQEPGAYKSQSPVFQLSSSSDDWMTPYQKPKKNVDETKSVGSEVFSGKIVDDGELSELSQKLVDSSELSQTMFRSELTSQKIVDNGDLSQKIINSCELPQTMFRSELTSQKITDSSDLSQKIVDNSDLSQTMFRSELTSQKIVDSRDLSQKIVDNSELSQKIVDNSESSQTMFRSEFTSQKIADSSDLRKKKIVDRSDLSQKIVDSSDLSNKILDASELPRKIVDSTELSQKIVSSGESPQKIADELSQKITDSELISQKQRSKAKQNIESTDDEPAVDGRTSIVDTQAHLSNRQRQRQTLSNCDKRKKPQNFKSAVDEAKTKITTTTDRHLSNIDSTVNALVAQPSIEDMLRVNVQQRRGSLGSAEETKIGSEKTELGAENTKLGAEKTELGVEKVKIGAEKTDIGAEKTKIGSENTKSGSEKTIEEEILEHHEDILLLRRRSMNRRNALVGESLLTLATCREVTDEEEDVEMTEVKSDDGDGAQRVQVNNARRNYQINDYRNDQIININENYQINDYRNDQIINYRNEQSNDGSRNNQINDETARKLKEHVYTTTTKPTEDTKVTTPYLPPPTFNEVMDSLPEHNLPFVRHQEPYYSDPLHITKSVEVGSSVLKIPSKTVRDLPEFASGFGSFEGAQRGAARVFYPDLKTTGELDRARLGHVQDAECTLTPVRKPPSRREVELWVKAKGIREQQRGETSKMDVEVKGKKEKKVYYNDDSSSDVELEMSMSLSPGTYESSQGSNKNETFNSGETTSSSLHRVMQNSTLFRRSSDSNSNNSHMITCATLNNTHGFKLTTENYASVKNKSEHQYVTSLVVELHVQTRGELKPDPQFDSIRSLFYAVRCDAPDIEKEIVKGIIAVNSNAFSPNKNLRCDILQGTGITCDEITYAETEAELYEKFFEKFHAWDPELLMGYEIEMLSWGYLIERGYVLGINTISRLSRIIDTSNKSLINKKEGQEDELRIPGRVVLDAWRLLRHELALTSYTFENLVYHVLHERVPLYSTSDLTNWWQHRSSAYRHRTANFYLFKVVAVLRLIDHFDLINRTSELSRLFGILFYEVLSRGSQFRVESMMLRMAKPLNYIPVSPSVPQRAKMRAPEYLPLILEPESKFYADPVIVLDFQSLYPSIIIGYNYCFSTCLGRVEHLGTNDPFEFGATQLKVSKNRIQKLLNKNQINFTPCGIAFVKKQTRLGILPRMLQEILDTRLMVKKALKDEKDNKTLKKILHSRQLGLKLIANVTYGYTAANFSGRMPAVEVGDSVVSKGRETLQRAIDLVEQTPKWDARVVYGDTDSLFVLVKGRSREVAFKIGEEIAEAVTQMNPSPVRLKLEKVYQPCILQTKKRYVGYMYESAEQKEAEFEAKGIETVRRDGVPAVAKMLEKCLRLLFETKDVSLVRRYCTNQFRKIMSGRISMQDLTFAKEYRGMGSYKQGACVPALELARKWITVDKRNEPRRGERVPYIIINGHPGVPLIKLVRSPRELLEDSSLRPNALYYITKVIIPPINRCFSLIGADLQAWFNEMPRKQYQYLPSSSPRKTGKKTTISQYFATTSCACCEKQTKEGLCADCKKNPQVSAVILHENVRSWERNYFECFKICQSCCGRQTDINCISLDCPVIYRVTQARRDLQQSNYVRDLINKLPSLEF